MSQMTLKVRKVKTIHPVTKAEGLSARVVTNGKASFDDICELAGLNTTLNEAELHAAGKLILQAAARELKNGKIVDLGPLGGIYPSVTSKWVAKAEDLQKSDLTLKVNYRPSDDIDAAVKGAKLAWASKEDEQREQEADETGGSSSDGDGGSSSDGDGGSSSDGSGTPPVSDNPNEEG